MIILENEFIVLFMSEFLLIMELVESILDIIMLFEDEVSIFGINVGDGFGGGDIIDLFGIKFDMVDIGGFVFIVLDEGISLFLFEFFILESIVLECIIFGIVLEDIIIFFEEGDIVIIGFVIEVIVDVVDIDFFLEDLIFFLIEFILIDLGFESVLMMSLSDLVVDIIKESGSDVGVIFFIELEVLKMVIDKFLFMDI